MGDWRELLQAAIITLIFAFLLSKLISIILSFKADRLKVVVASHDEDDAQIYENRAFDSRVQNEGISGEDGDLDDEDDDSNWEESESSELDEIFNAATTFVAATAADKNAAKVSSDVQLQLYGFYKVAIEGRCTAPQPSAFNVTARAKWNAWQKLGDMSSEEAMAKYVAVVSELYPSWLGSSSVKRTDGEASTSALAAKGPVGPVFSSFVHEEESDNDLRLEPIHGLAREGKTDDLLQLLDGGISVDVKDGEGRTPLHWAVDRGHIDVVEALLSKKSDINAKDNEGQTPLHYAVLCEREAIAELLIRQNADSSIKDEDGVSPHDLAGSRWTFMTVSA